MATPSTTAAQSLRRRRALLRWALAPFLLLAFLLVGERAEVEGAEADLFV